MSSLAAPLQAWAVYALIGCLVLAAAPHVANLPPWIPIAAGTLFLWRGAIEQHRARLPGRWLILTLVLLGGLGVLLSFGSVVGRDSGVALLVVMLGLKVMELRTRRDANVVVLLAYFLIITTFLYSQSIPLALYTLAVLWAVTATMVGLQLNPGRLEVIVAARISGLLLLQATPLMVVLFVLFPRVQGPLWGLPQAQQAAVSGLSDTMSPGSLSRLSLSDAVAFRVDFDAPPPKPSTLYWRGPVLWDFDGRTWSMRPSLARPMPPAELLADPISYAVTLEPHNLRWLFGIDLPHAAPASATVTDDYQLLAVRPVRSRQRYELRSSLAYRYGLNESAAVLTRAVRLPPGSNPRSRGLALALRAEARDDADMLRRVLAMFRTEHFFYTLVPPELGLHSVDEFLFATKRGFCEHYTSSFVFLMRAAGIPARVVTGYQGGEINPLGGYLIVRQSEAHAWAEVWLQGQGWVRVDPTAAVSPARIESGIAAAVPAGEPLPLFVRTDSPWMRRLRFTWDAAANSWNQWVLGYTPDRQSRLLLQVGMRNTNWQQLALLLLIASGIVLLILAALLLRRLRFHPPDAVQRAWQRFCRKLARLGVTRAPFEGPIDYARRAASVHPELAPQVHRIAATYARLRYGALPAAGDGDRLKRLVRRFRA